MKVAGEGLQEDLDLFEDSFSDYRRTLLHDKPLLREQADSEPPPRDSQRRERRVREVVNRVRRGVPRSHISTVPAAPGRNQLSLAQFL